MHEKKTIWLRQLNFIRFNQVISLHSAKQIFIPEEKIISVILSKLFQQNYFLFFEIKICFPPYKINIYFYLNARRKQNRCLKYPLV